MSTKFTRHLVPRLNPSSDFLKVTIITLATLAFVSLSVTAHAQESATGGGAEEADAERNFRRVVKSVVQETLAEKSKAEQTAAERADVGKTFTEVGTLIRNEQFEEASKEIRALEETYSKDADWVKQLKSYLAREMEEANKKAPLQAVKDEIPDLLLSGNTTEAKNKIAEARKSFPQDKGLLELSATVTYAALLKKILIVVGLLAALSAIAVGIIYIWSKFVAACVYVFAVYLTAIPVGALLFLVVGPILAVTGPPETDAAAAANRELQNMFILMRQVGIATLSCCAGALGGAIAASFALVTSPLRARTNVRFSTYFFKPVNGFFIAFIMYVGVMSGQLAFSSSGGELGDQARWSICLLAILSGFFSDAAIEKLREIKQALFGKEVAVVLDIDEIPDDARPKKTRREAEKVVGLPVLEVELAERGLDVKRNGGEEVV
ncbi:MAG TPA: hypothetical protein VF588_16885 [Pyrinomonadaceae bacterium]|jgi:hypothetical protein